jgi:hypothetical protein
MFQDSRHRIVPREYAIFGGLDVDKKRMAVTFGDHGQLLQSLQMPYSSSHLINYLDKHFAGCKSRWRMKSGLQALVFMTI